MASGSEPDPQLFAEPQATQPDSRVASVALVQKVDRIYSYLVPAEMAETLQPGCRVQVPLGKADRLVTGYCLKVSREGWKSTLKPLCQLLDPVPLLGRHMLELGRWIAKYYATSLGITLEAMVPAGVKSAGRPPMIRCALWTGPADPQALGDLPAAQRRIAEILLPLLPHALPVAQLLEQARCTQGPLRTLADKGLVDIVETPDDSIDATLLSTPNVTDPDYELNEDQQRAYRRVCAAVQAGGFRVQVLYGVTGSGKTEVYIRAIRDCLAAGKQALLMVPEIGLTTQTVSRLAGRLPNLVSLHSGLTDLQRTRAWQLITSGKARVVVGTRSAVFAPCPNLGLIVIDEEQESSYKNMQAPRFHSRDVAIKRAQMLNIPILLGSATPSLETWLNAHQLPHYELLRLPRRVRGLPLPSVLVVDMRNEQRQRKGIHLLSRAMELKLGQTLQCGQQAVLLLNRRGYASYIFCPSCGRRVTCPRCKVNMVFHQAADQAVCHYCNSHFPVPAKCPAPNCGHKLVRFGMGTQRVEQELQEKFPNARVARVDSDRMTKAAQFATLLSDFESKKIDILIGTQMVAKGLDFPFVSFVGVVSADTSLSLPDFRSAERTFQLVTQVAGRAGRAATPGSAVVQTFASDLLAVSAALKHDYERFAQAELASRKKMRFPPYWRLTRVLMEDRRMARLRAEAEKFVSQTHSLLNDLPDPADLIGPQPAPIEKVRDRYRYDVLLRARTARAMQALLDRIRGRKLLDAKVQRVILDVDPVSLL